MKKNNNIAAFFALLRAGLWEKEVKLAPYGTRDFSAVLDLAEEQSVVGLHWAYGAAGAEESGDELFHRGDGGEDA